MNFATSRSPYFGSGRIRRFCTSLRRGIGPGSLFEKSRVTIDGADRTSSGRALRPVLAAAALATLDSHRIQSAADDVVANSGKVLHTASADHDDGVLLKIVPHPGDVAGDLDPVGQANARDLTERGVRLLRSRGVDPRTDAPLLRRSDQRGGLVLRGDLLAALADQLTDGRHSLLIPRAYACSGAW